VAANGREVVVVRLRLALTIAGVLAASTASAQQPLYTGMITPYLGASAGGDVEGRKLTPGASMTVLDTSGIGAELDVAHTRQIDESRFSESAITSVMVNVVGMWRVSNVRPFVVSGLGLLRVRAALPDAGLVTSRTDWAFDAGAGVLYLFDDLIGVRGDVRYFRYLQRHDDLPLRDNGFFDYWRTSIGVTFAWPIR
jgi:opacity protein-like surface antigen